MVARRLLFGRRVHRADLHAEARHPGASPRGKLETRVDIRTGDEFGELGDAFNTMADRLVELQENVKRQERQAMFGRIAAGLVHDLSHPIQNIGNSARLLSRDDLDAESREIVPADHRARARHPQAVHGRPAQHRQAEADRAVRDGRQRVGRGDRRSDAGRRRAHRRRGRGRYADGPLDDRRRSIRARPRLPQPDHQRDSGDRGRRHGDDHDGARRRPGRRSRVTDTGSGIPPERLAAIFDDFVTTKRRGLGLGLAISKRIVEQLDGTITVESEVGRGTAFTLRFPARDDGTRGGSQLSAA